MSSVIFALAFAYVTKDGPGSFITMFENRGVCQIAEGRIASVLMADPKVLNFNVVPGACEPVALGLKT